VLGVGFAVLLAILNAIWGENEEARRSARNEPGNEPRKNARQADASSAHDGTH
jgi:predicted outer membrane lipoprotein